MKKERNCSIDIFRYLCAILVVAVHTNPFTDVEAELGYICTQIIPRIGVPFFFAAAGYFYLAKLEEGKKAFFSYISRVLITYVIWTVFYYIIDYVQWGRDNIFKFKHVIVEQFFVTGSHYHFWFFPALLFAVCVTTLLFKIRCRKLLIPLSLVLYALGCIGCAYFNLGIKIPVLGPKLYRSHDFELIRRVVLMGFPFFVSGYLIYRIKDRVFQKLSNKGLVTLLAVSVLIWLAEIQLVRKMNWQANIVITFGLYLMLVVVMLLLIRNPLPERRKLSDAAKVTANFIYYFHPMCIMLVNHVAGKYFQVGVGATKMFFLTAILTTFLGLIIYKLNNKVLNFIVK